MTNCEYVAAMLPSDKLLNILVSIDSIPRHHIVKSNWYGTES